MKQRRPGAKKLRKGIRQQLQYVRRDLKHINALLDALPGQSIPLPARLLRKFWVIQQLYEQQAQMYQTKTKRCDDRIVSIHQPQVRPMVRGKANKAVEFGAKLSVSLTGQGIAGVDHIRWDAYHEGLDLPAQVEIYKERYGHYTFGVKDFELELFFNVRNVLNEYPGIVPQDPTDLVRLATKSSARTSHPCRGQVGDDLLGRIYRAGVRFRL